MIDLPISSIFQQLRSSDQGIAPEDVSERRSTYGANTIISTTRKERPLYIFLAQWKSPLMIILVVAAAISLSLHEYIDAIVIGITILLNAIIGFVQEYKANEALEHLQSSLVSLCVVVRGGEQVRIPQSEVVLGDYVLLEAGATVPADGRIVVAHECTVDEAPLTGESIPRKKFPGILPVDTPLADQSNMLFRGTTITNGSAQMVVTAIGGQTQLGTIAALVAETTEEDTPLQKQLHQLAKVMSIIVVCICIAILGLGMLLGGEAYSLVLLIETAIAVAVAAIPEGLVISLTVVLAIGMQFILKKNALVRKLVAAETLGSVSVICTDKTGTLTIGDMRVHEIHVGSRAYSKDEWNDTDPAYLLEIAAQASTAARSHSPEGERIYLGDTTEIALLRAQDGLNESPVDGIVRDEIPFDSDKKYMARLVDVRGTRLLCVKGALEALRPMIADDQQERYDALSAAERAYSDHGLRVLAVGVRTCSEDAVEESDVCDLELLGIVAMRDPLRKEVAQTIQGTQAAGIRVVMITGDHARTARAIAEELGLIDQSGIVVTGQMLDEASDKKREALMQDARVFARVTPAHKLAIVHALQAKGEVVAMTGDGVNDAPAIKAATIGIAVGSGTDVAKGTSDMVILDDRFTTIVDAVASGRGLYDNIKKVVVYLLSGSFAEVVMITGSIVAGLPVAALPAQILWINLIEDAFPVMALAFDPADPENMNEPPRPKHAPLIDQEMKRMIVIKSVLANVLLFAIFYVVYRTTQNIDLARTLVFVGFGIDALFYIFAIRNLRKNIWHYHPFENKYLVGSVLFGWVALITAVHLPLFQTLLRTVPLHLGYWMLMIGFGVANLCMIEGVKVMFFRSHQKSEH